jgi:hypothetical protein
MTAFKFRKITAAAFVLGLLAPVSGAQADGLYAAPPPSGSAFVRFIDGDANGAKSIVALGRTYSLGDQGAVTAYNPIPQGKADFAVGAAKTDGTLKAGTYYSVVLYKGKLSILEEPAFDGKLKAQIAAINLSSAADAAVKTADGATAVAGPAAPEAIAARDVNAVKIGLSTYAGATKVKDLPAQPLERNVHYAAVFFDKGGKTDVSFDKSTGF